MHVASYILVLQRSGQGVLYVPSPPCLQVWVSLVVIQPVGRFLSIGAACIGLRAGYQNVLGWPENNCGFLIRFTLRACSPLKLNRLS